MRRRMMKVAAACLIVAVSAPGVAVAAGRQGEPLNDPSLTYRAAAEWKQATERKEAQVQAAASAPRATAAAAVVSAAATSRFGLHTVSSTNYRQETSYYCGPASARQSLSWHKAKSGSGTALPSQSTLAGRIGTTSSGSLTSGIARALNSYDSTFGNVYYVASNLTDTSNPTSTFYTRIGLMIEGGVTAPVILTQTSRIPRYNGHASRHYMTVSGIDDRTSTVKMRSVDPNWSSAYRGVYWDNMGSTSVNGLCRACYQADLDGSNLAMAW